MFPRQGAQEGTVVVAGQRDKMAPFEGLLHRILSRKRGALEEPEGEGGRQGELSICKTQLWFSSHLSSLFLLPSPL